MESQAPNPRDQRVNYKEGNTVKTLILVYVRICVYLYYMLCVDVI